jgi:PAS domain S-box-containing protein
LLKKIRDPFITKSYVIKIVRMNIEPILILAAKIGGAIAAIALIWKYLKQIVSFSKSFLLMPEMVKKIELETKTNGGASIKDSLNRIEKRQLIQEQRTLHLLEISCEIGIFEADPHGNIIRSNSMFAAITGKSQDELQGNSWINNLSHEDRDRVYNEFSLAINQKRLFSSVFSFKNGELLTEVEGKMNPIISKDNDIIIWIALFRKKGKF